jgi:hypothetical protein
MGKVTLVGLDERAAELLKNFIAHHNLLPKGKSYRLQIEVGNYESGHFCWYESKTVRSDACPSNESMEEEDWQEILNLPTFREVSEDSLPGKLRALVLKFKAAEGQPIEVQSQHQSHLNRVFQNLCLQYHVFRAGGTSYHPLWRLRKKL